MPHARAPGHALCRLFDVFYHGRLRAHEFYINSLCGFKRCQSYMHLLRFRPALSQLVSISYYCSTYLLLQENMCQTKKIKKTHSPFKKGFDIAYLHKTHTRIVTLKYVEDVLLLINVKCCFHFTSRNKLLSFQNNAGLLESFYIITYSITSCISTR